MCVHVFLWQGQAAIRQSLREAEKEDEEDPDKKYRYDSEEEKQSKPKGRGRGRGRGRKGKGRGKTKETSSGEGDGKGGHEEGKGSNADNADEMIGETDKDCEGKDAAKPCTPKKTPKKTRAPRKKQVAKTPDRRTLSVKSPAKTDGDQEKAEEKKAPKTPPLTKTGKKRKFQKAGI